MHVQAMGPLLEYIYWNLVSPAQRLVQLARAWRALSALSLHDCGILSRLDQLCVVLQISWALKNLSVHHRNQRQSRSRQENRTYPNHHPQSQERSAKIA